jgi:hypothetical protein
MRDNDTNSSKGFAFINFASFEAAGLIYYFLISTVVIIFNNNIIIRCCFGSNEWSIFM